MLGKKINEAVKKNLKDLSLDRDRKSVMLANLVARTVVRIMQDEDMVKHQVKTKTTKEFGPEEGANPRMPKFL